MSKNMSRNKYKRVQNFQKKLLHPLLADKIIFEVFWSDVKHKVHQRQLESCQIFREKFGRIREKGMLVLNFPPMEIKVDLLKCITGYRTFQLRSIRYARIVVLTTFSDNHRNYRLIQRCKQIFQNVSELIIDAHC